MTIQPTDSDHCTADSPFSETAEKGTFYLVSFSALSIGLPAAARKRRTYTPLSLPTPLPEPEAPPPPLELSGNIPPTPVPLCTAEEKAKIEELFGTIATANFISLIRNKAYLEQLGSDIDAVHPFSLLLAMPKEAIRQIFLSYNVFTSSNVMGGIEKGIRREEANLDLYLPSFASQMNKQEVLIKQLIQQSDWRGLVHYLFDIAP